MGSDQTPHAVHLFIKLPPPLEGGGGPYDFRKRASRLPRAFRPLDADDFGRSALKMATAKECLHTCDSDFKYPGRLIGLDWRPASPVHGSTACGFG